MEGDLNDPCKTPHAVLPLFARSFAATTEKATDADDDDDDAVRRVSLSLSLSVSSFPIIYNLPPPTSTFSPPPVLPSHFSGTVQK